MMTLVEVKTVDGSVLEVPVTVDRPTVGDVCDVLVADFQYRKNVRLMFGGQVLMPGRYMDEFPSAALIVVGTKAAPANQNGRTPSISPSRRSLPAAHIAVRILVPSSQTQHTIHLHKDSTVGDLVTHALARDPTLHGCRALFNGHELKDLAAELRHYGVGDGATVHFAAKTIDPNILKLQEAQRTLKDFEARATAADVEMRKSLYEQSMRLLFSLDGLMDLEGDARLARKDLVKNIQSFQDSLGVGHQ